MDLPCESIPHMLLYGPPGTGKTSTILATAKMLYSPKELHSMLLELNASDARGINVVREQILGFASTKTLFTGKIKLIVLDEADSMTKDAQNALRRVIEKYSDNTRFCLICNYLSKIIPAIQSRCTKFRFAPVLQEKMGSRLYEICENEGVKMTSDGLNAVTRLSNGDMRRAINILQGASMSFGDVDENAVYACVAYPKPSEIRSLLDCLFNETISQAYKKIQSTKQTVGIALQDILTEIHLMLFKIDLPDSVRSNLIASMADIEHRLSLGASEKLLLTSLISSFAKSKDFLLKQSQD